MAAFFDASGGALHPVSEDRVLALLGDGTESDIEEFHDDLEDSEPIPNVLANFVEEDDHSEDSGNEMEPEPISQVTTSNRERSPIFTSQQGCPRDSTAQRAQTGSSGRSRGITSRRIRGRGRSCDIPVQRTQESSRGRARSTNTNARRTQASNRGRARSTNTNARRTQASSRGRARSTNTNARRMQSGSRGRSTTTTTQNMQQRHGETWKSIPFTDKPHEYATTLPIKPVRTPTEYVNDYFDDDFYEMIARCTNLYYMRKTGQELKTTKAEIAKVFGVHIIMGCLPYPRMPMYWRANMRIGLIADKIVRDRFITIRNALHVVDHDQPIETERDNPLWKIQPMIKRVQDTCNKLERVPSYYSIDEQMIPFCGKCPLRQVIKTKPRPVGLKNFVLTTSDGLMLDFEIYRGANTMFTETSLGLGPSVILHLIKSVPPGSCVYHDRFFTTIPLVEEMNRRNLHSTGTIQLNRIPDRASCKFKKDYQMARGESQHYTRDSTVIVRWKDSKCVIVASNCTGSSSGTDLKRWDKIQRCYIDVPAPKVIQQYNKHMGGVDILDQQMEYYRFFIKTKKWTLKVIIHFLDLALVNSWRLYKNDCVSNGYSRKDIITLLDFRLNVADALTNFPEQDRRDENVEAENEPPPINKQYRPVRPSLGKRYDGYDHLAVFDDIQAPRSCMMHGCRSRSKVKCSKCAVYLCLSRNQNCFQSYHLKP